MSKLVIHPKFKPLYNTRGDKRYLVFYGGRFGLKSWACADAMIVLCSSERLTCLCAREIQLSLSESVHSLLCSSIEKLGLSTEWDINKERLMHANGSKIYFRGLRNNKDNIKSLEAIDICWVEEAQAVTEDTWEYLDPTIRKNEKCQIWVTFNPDDELDPTYTRYISAPRDRSLVVKTSWRDADEMGWFPDSIRVSMEQMKRENYRKYEHYWEGEPNSNYEDAIIQPEWVEAAIDAHVKLNWEPLGQRVTSFDPADTHDDRAIASRHGFLITELESWTNLDLPRSVTKAYQMAFSNRSEKFVYDADGLGAALKMNLEQMEQEFKVSASAFKGGMTADDPDAPYPPYDYRNFDPSARTVSNKDTFANKRAQYYWFLKDRLENTYNAVVNNKYVNPDECISFSSKIPEDTLKQLRRELTRIRRKRGANSSRITLESKSDMKKAQIKSPGLADCMMMVFANQDAFGAMPKIKMRSEW